jgi:hypothetical protein
VIPARCVCVVTVLASCALLRAQLPMVQTTGTVTDAETGAPIESFWIIPGSQSTNGRQYFQYAEAVEQQNGEYVHLHHLRSHGHILRIEADGYLPVASPELDAEEDSTFDAKLRRGANVTGRVVTSEGEPAAGAEVMIISDYTSAQLENQRPAEHAGSPLAVTDEQGRFSLRPVTDGAYDIVAVHDVGRARVTSKRIASGEPVRLQSWARVEGILMIGAKPAAGQQITMSWAGSKSDWDTRDRCEYRTKTDDAGRFAFDRVHAGDLNIGRIVRVEAGARPLSGTSNRQIIATRAGETTSVQLGGAGRAVIGRVVFPPDMPEQFTVSQPQLGPPPQRLRAAATSPPSPDKRTAWDELFTYMHIVPLKPDGTFRIEDVLPGEYVLNLDFREHDSSGPDPRGFGRTIGSVNLPITISPIPGGRTDEPLDLGELRLTRPEEK